MGWGDGGVSFLDKVKEDPAVEEKEEAPVLSTDGSLVRVVVLDSNAIFKGYGHRPGAQRVACGGTTRPYEVCDDTWDVAAS
jgi:hypothetical protein